ncbi:MAG: type VI secretion system tip protein VgrG [Planctomycetes bacterium]|nr:type VI secretion system tip protein VgrG [Planctomycetota bacterium]
MSTLYTQEGRGLALETPLGKDVLLLTHFSGREEMSRLFSYHLEMLSENDSIAPKDIVGKNVTVAVRLPDDSQRFFNGYVSRFSYCGTDDRLSRYTAEVVPWLWFLTMTSDCRIFQKKKVPQIIEQIFSDLGFSDFETSEIKGAHPEWEYCVQYRETDFNFVSRMMEQEGVFYYFRHENGKHILVLADHKGAYKDAPETEVEFAASLRGPEQADQITSWVHKYEFRPGKWAHTDYNFQNPTVNLMATTKTVVQLENIDKFEIYDYPGEYEKKDEGEAEVKVRMEEEEVSYDIVSASSKCRTFSPGYKFKVVRHHHKAEEGKTFAITAIEHNISLAGAYTTSGGGGGEDYSNTFTCIPESVTFRPARITPKPQIQGSQTAVVVGPSGEEIYTDEFGRIKVQFHWDREGKKDDNSSCWIRVAQSWAGPNWGTIFLPRIGHEVLVEFLEGDPDRPLVTGSLYNKSNMPPYPLPDQKTTSGIKSLSSTGGEGFNEIRFEDKKGEEQIFIHAEKNQDIRVKNDTYEWIGNDRHLVVKNDQVEHVENNRSEIVDQDHMEEIGKDRHLKVAGKEAIEIGDSHSFTVKGDVIEVFKANHSEETTGDYYLKAANIVIEATTNVTIKVGESHIAIESSGIKIGTTGQIKVEATGQAEVKATGPLKLESTATADLKGAKTTVSGDAMTEIKGGMVKIN